MSAPGESAPEEDLLELQVVDTGQTLTRWNAYEFGSNFRTAADGFSLETGGKENPPAKEVEALKPGARVQLRIRGLVQATGYIDDVEPDTSPSKGKILKVTGKDVMGPLVMGGADPFNLKFSPNQTLADFVEGVFAPYGFKTYTESDAANRAVRTGLRAEKFTKVKGKPIKSSIFTEQLKPHPGESIHQYATRIINRAGYFFWPSADGTSVVVGLPDYEQAAIAKLTRRIDDPTANNILSGGVKCRTSRQVGAIIATGFTGGGEWPRSHYKVGMMNELVTIATGIELGAFEGSITTSPRSPGLTNVFRDSRFSDSRLNVRRDLDDIFLENDDCLVLSPRQFPDSVLRPLPYSTVTFLHDDEAKTQDQLIRFVQREMSHIQCEMWVGDYVVHGHTYNGVPWTVNTIVDVDDDHSNFHAPMWVGGRSFIRQGRSPMTHLQLILPHTMEFP
ncbi:MAG TPA: hypothetical protein VGI39_38995 [Polyangiaceae bacterium]|jgi:prophage tail gpP-like protein